MKKIIVVIILCLCCISSQVQAQSFTKNTNNTKFTSKQNTFKKKHLTPKDYDLWYEIKNHSISDNGEWYTYFEKGKDSTTLFVGSTKNKIKYNFPNGGVYFFSAENTWFACLIPKKALRLLNLETGEIKWIPNVANAEFSLDGNFLIYKEIEGDNISNLVIHNLKTSQKDHFTNISDYIMSPDGKQLVYIQNAKAEKVVGIMNLDQSKPTIITKNSLHNYKHLLWNANGNSLAFLQEQVGVNGEHPTYKICNYKIEKGRTILYILNPITDATVFPEKDIVYNDLKLKFAPNGSTLYFEIGEVVDQETIGDTEGEVEIWRANNKKLLYPLFNAKMYQQLKPYVPRLASWHPETGKTVVLENENLPKAAIGNKGSFMLSYNPLVYEPSFAKKGNNDIHITDLKTGMSHLLLKEYAGNVFMSPEGNYINYFRDKHWWIYDIDKQVHVNITKDLPSTWYKSSSKYREKYKNGLNPYGSPGWTKGDEELIVYDKYDVWLISPKGKAKKLTDGKASKIKYRIYKNMELYKGQIKSSFANYFNGGVNKISKEVNFSEDVIFKTEGANKSSGYSVWKKGKGIEVLVYKDMLVTDLRKSKNKDSYTYVEQSFQTSPRIVYLKREGSAPKILNESNSHQKQFHWGRSELVYYKGPNGEDLMGALFYPADYRQGEKYPMIVQIYESMSGTLHKYRNPSREIKGRINPTNYTAEGYLIFHPDIDYTFNDIGVSAIDCVELGIKKVIEKDVVEVDHIGLIGHSFGGYETNFIITQSDLFATAVSGSGVSDLVSWYHDFSGPYTNIGTNTWRCEDLQFGFKGSFHEIPEAYIRNSPIHHITNINTPLLLWAGKKDDSVSYKQSVEMYFGLRRLNKICELLLYPNERHIIRNTKNQVDLSRRIKSWFEKYLKPL